MPTPDLSNLSAAELDAVIAEAAQRRAALQPPVAPEPPQGETTGILDPAWRSMLVWPNTVLMLRHPGLGWLTFVFPPHERTSLLALFLRQALAPAPVAPTNAAPSVTTGGGTLH